MQSMVSHPGGLLSGSARVPGDKSISHRALLLAACATGETRIRGLLEADDVLATMAAITALGATVDKAGETWCVAGRGVGGLHEPARVLDLGNSGTAARLLMGVAAGLAFPVFLSGDASLSRRPMHRVLEPLSRMGVRFWSRSGGRLPIAIHGCDDLLPIRYELPVPSAQVKSAVLLAGLGAAGATTVIEREPTRDHTERMLEHFGAPLDVRDGPDGGRTVTVIGHAELRGCDVTVPGDFSSAAFLLVGAMITPGSRVTLEGVGVNPGRTGLLEVLRAMGGEVAVRNRRSVGGEPVADLDAGFAPLHGVSVPAERVPAMIDEFPVLAVAAACAEGETRMTGLSELRVKESDRLAAIARGLAACGVRVEAGDDRLTIQGCSGPPPGGADVRVNLDHRIAMAFLLLGAASRAPVRVDDASSIATSFPDFAGLLNRLGLRMEPT